MVSISNNNSIDKDTSFYIVTLRYDNFLQLKDNDFSLIGFSERSKIAEKLKQGDKLVIYIGSRVSKIAGIIEINSTLIWDNDLIWDDIFPKRYKTNKVIILDPEKYVEMRLIKDGLSFIKPEVIRFGVYFMNGLKKLKIEDYDYIYKHCINKMSISEN